MMVRWHVYCMIDGLYFFVSTLLINPLPMDVRNIFISLGLGFWGERTWRLGTKKGESTMVKTRLDEGVGGGVGVGVSGVIVTYILSILTLYRTPLSCAATLYEYDSIASAYPFHRYAATWRESTMLFRDRERWNICLSATNDPLTSIS